MHGERVAILLDAGFVKKRLAKRAKQFPTMDDVRGLLRMLVADPSLQDSRLFRIYWYDADPFDESRKNPIDGKKTNFRSTLQAKRNRKLLEDIEKEPNVAVRKGELLFRGWRVTPQSMKDLAKDPPKGLRANHLEPVFIQKGVDMRIGLDIASLALKRLVDAIVLVTGDADMVPAMKLARREGLRVYLHCLGSREVRNDLVVHSDRLLGAPFDPKTEEAALRS